MFRTFPLLAILVGSNPEARQSAFFIIVSVFAVCAVISILNGFLGRMKRFLLLPKRVELQRVWTDKIGFALGSKNVAELRVALLEAEKLLDLALIANGYKNASFVARLSTAVRNCGGAMYRAEFFKTVVNNVRAKKEMKIERMQGALKDCQKMLRHLGLWI